MRLHFPVDLTGNLVMIEKLVLGEIWTGDLPIFNPDALTSAPSRQAKKFNIMQGVYNSWKSTGILKSPGNLLDFWFILLEK